MTSSHAATDASQPTLRDRLARAQAHADPASRLAALAELAAEGPGIVETIQIDRALRALKAHDVPGWLPLRVAILSSHTVDHLLPALRVAGLRRRLLVEARAGAYGQYRHELLQPPDDLAAFQPEVVVLSIGMHVMPGASVGDAASEQSALDAALEDLRRLWRAAREQLGAGLVVQQSFLDVGPPLFGVHDQAIPGTPARLCSRLNARLADAVATDRILLLDVAAAAAREGLDAWFDAARWLQAKMEIAPAAAYRYADALARLLSAQHGRSAKCLVLDLDNTLWGGVLGDVGVDGIVLGEGSAVGEAHAALQRYARALKQRGVILAVCSKNDAAVAEQAFRDHPDMVLRRDDIACFVANWSDKAENLQRIAAMLNIGVDSLVFVDDNPVERARVRAALPAVAVPELPDDPAQYVRCLAQSGHFEAVALTSEDMERAAHYAANAERDASRGAAESVEQFLCGLGMTLDCGPARPVDHARVAQLINKTNQFNTTGRRRSEPEIVRLAGDPAWAVLQFRLADRFGDNGLVSALLLAPATDDASALEIDSWVMSCRVFGRQLEAEVMNYTVETARQRGARRLHAAFKPTDRNQVVAGLFARLGFDACPSSDPSLQRFVLELDRYAVQPTFIQRRSATT